MSQLNLEVAEEEIQLDVPEKHSDNNNNNNNNNNKNSSSEKSENKDEGGRKAKGRGFATDSEKESKERYSGKGAQFETLASDQKAGPQRSVEGWIVFVRNLHEEASEDDLLDRFSEYGEVKNLQVPLDRTTGYIKGYAMVEYEAREEAENAVHEMNGTEFMDQKLEVDFSFVTSDDTRSYRKSRDSRSSRKHHHRH